MYNLSETYHSLNPLILRKTSFHEMMMLYKRTVNKLTKEKKAEGNQKCDRVVQDDEGNINIYRQAGDNWF